MANEDRGMGQALVSDLRSLIKPAQEARQLPALALQGAAPGKRGTGTYKEKDSTVAGIASPLQEQDASQRTYFDPQLVESSDGLFTLRIEPLERLEMRDANGDEVVFRFKAPPVQDL